MVRRILDRAPELAAFPDSGRVVPESADPTIREILEGPYRVIYRRGPDAIEMLTIVHGRQLFPNIGQAGPEPAT